MKFRYPAIFATSLGLVVLAGCSNEQHSTQPAPAAGSRDAATLVATNAARTMMLKIDPADVQGDRATVTIHVADKECSMSLNRTERTTQNELGWLVDGVNCPDSSPPQTAIANGPGSTAINSSGDVNLPARR